jgi:ATP-dependent RNA helicase DeaD
MSPSREKVAGGFAGLGLADELVAAVVALGYEEPTPIQREAIPLLIQGRDLLGQAATGTGKTAAFALPMIQRIAQDPQARKVTSGLILVPTRELSMQVAEAVHKYAKGFGIHVVAVYGGAPMFQQIRALERGAAIVVATPGRALDLIRRQNLVLDELKVLALDEADEMLDMGFAEDLDAILNATPEGRQTALFSATMPARIIAIAKRHLKNPARVAIATEKPAAGALPRVRQVVYNVTRANKPAVLSRVLEVESPASAIVFCRTRLEVESLVETLSAHGHRAQALHGGMQQRDRDRVMKLFRAGKTDLLVATDVAARGLDIEHLSHVVNYDVPAAPEAYVHRIGRTGRAGRAGTAITLAEPREHRLLRSIEQLTRHRMEVATVPTMADLRAKKLGLMQASLRERLLKKDFESVRVVVEALAQEFDPLDIAAAAVTLVHEATAADGEESAAGGVSEDSGDRFRGRTGERGSGGRNPRGHTVRLFIGAGRQAGIRPGDLVGAITGEAGIDSRELGSIEIADRFSLVEVPEAAADSIIEAMRSATLRGRRVPVRRDREGR